MVSTGLIRDYIINEEKTYLIREAIANGASQYDMQTFDQSLFRLLQARQISFEEAIHNATNPDEFKLRMSGILSSDQPVENAAGNTDSVVRSEPQRDEFESLIVKL